MKKTYAKGSPEWRELFYDNDVRAMMTPEHEFNSVDILGDISALVDPERPKVLITGTRNMSLYGASAVRDVINALAENPNTPVVVSGLAVGIDTSVHRAALEAGLPTVAVLPSGIDTVYPAMNQRLAEKIISKAGCCLLSQFPEGTKPNATNMLLRRKVMAMISDVAVIPETAIKGAAMLIAYYMDERNRRVFAVPGRLGDIQSEGCNQLIERNVAEIYTGEYGRSFLKNLSVLRKSNEYLYK